MSRQNQHDELVQAWVTDITYIHTLEGWLYLAVVLDLNSRAVEGWSNGIKDADEYGLDALTMALWSRKLNVSLIIHSNQENQFGSDEFSLWCKDNRLSMSMIRRGNCWGNAVTQAHHH